MDDQGRIDGQTLEVGDSRREATKICGASLDANWTTPQSLWLAGPPVYQMLQTDGYCLSFSYSSIVWNL